MIATGSPILTHGSPLLTRSRQRWDYWRRVLAAYLGSGASQLSFWHELPAANFEARIAQLGTRVSEAEVRPQGRSDPSTLGQYFMTFEEKADYQGPFDDNGIPLLDYRGRLGKQYNPIAIAQYGLGNFNQFHKNGSGARRRRFLRVADWLTENLEENGAGLKVWHHHFDWEYRDTLRAPWYSGLAQGQGISVLVRAAQDTGEARYQEAADKAFEALVTPVDKGGTLFVDREGRKWIEEYIVEPPTHILNGFLWALWGVRDYASATGNEKAGRLFEDCVETLKSNLARFDSGFWSLYEQSGTGLKMMASPFYHALHIVQLQVMHWLTGEEIFQKYALKWEGYRRSFLKRNRALAHKIVFKVLYY